MSRPSSGCTVRSLPRPSGCTARGWIPSCCAAGSRPAERVGGHYRIWQGEAGGFECELLELVPSERIVFRWGFVGPERLAGPAFDSLLTITLREEQNGATALTLVHERLDDLHAAMPWVAENVGPGWEMVLGKLAAIIEEVA